jgi:hypothetical protein
MDFEDEMHYFHITVYLFILEIYMPLIIVRGCKSQIYHDRRGGEEKNSQRPPGIEP